MVNCPRGTKLAWSVPSGDLVGTENPWGPIANAESPSEAQQEGLERVARGHGQ